MCHFRRRTGTIKKNGKRDREKERDREGIEKERKKESEEALL